MLTVILVIHLLLAIALVGSVLLQRSEGGALGIGGGGGMGGFMTGRATANLLTRATAILAGFFFATSLILAIMGSSGHGGGSILDEPAVGQPATEAPVVPAEPAPPAEPAAPLAK